MFTFLSSRTPSPVTSAPSAPPGPPVVMLSPPRSETLSPDSDEELVKEMDAELSAAWSLTDTETGDEEKIETEISIGAGDKIAVDKSPEARVMDHSYLVRLQVSDSPSPPAPETETLKQEQRQTEMPRQDKKQIEQAIMHQLMEPGLITFTEEVLVTNDSETDM